LVIPKRLRDELGVRGPTNLELTAVEGKLELTVADAPAQVQDGRVRASYDAMGARASYLAA
jgi:bifunctional DNA-binding transcriptional regulator/antitoxin component of YhaV-PrlF toxin-antitoxin module